MATKRRQILMVNRNGIVLLNDLIPKDVTMFEYECNEDGRIVLTPFPGAQSPEPVQIEAEERENKKVNRGQLIDFRLGQARRAKQGRKGGTKVRTKTSNLPSEQDEQFVRLHSFPSRMEAEMVGEILNQAEIPFLIQSDDIGIFGPSAAPAPGGARLVVRQADLDAAKGLLSGLI